MIFKNPVIITTDQNICGRNLRQYLLDNWKWKETKEKFDDYPIYTFQNLRLVYSKKDIIQANHLDKLNADLLIFGSRHKSKANKQSLLTHVTGNFSADNSFGGNPYELAFASTTAIRESYLSLKEEQRKLSLDNFDVTVEATHHGPTNLKSPLVFVEVGSTEVEYNNTAVLQAASKTIMKIGLLEKKQPTIPAICFGGGHYTTRFNELMELTDVAIGHILPKYQKKNLTNEIVEQMIEKTIEEVKWAIIDRNSLNNAQIGIIKDAAESYNVEVVKAKDIKYNIVK